MDAERAQPIAPSLPTQAHRIAADRAMRLAAHAGHSEALEFYDELTPGERRIVFAMLARVAGRRHLQPVPPDQDVPWWTPAELEAAHKAVVTCGPQAGWLTIGARMFARQRRTREPTGSPARRGKPWTVAEDHAVLHGTTTDRELALKLGRGVDAISKRRALLLSALPDGRLPT